MTCSEFLIAMICMVYLVGSFSRHKATLSPLIHLSQPRHTDKQPQQPKAYNLVSPQGVDPCPLRGAHARVLKHDAQTQSGPFVLKTPQTTQEVATLIVGFALVLVIALLEGLPNPPFVIGEGLQMVDH